MKSGEVRRLHVGAWCGRGRAEMTSAALMHWQAGVGVEGSAASNGPPRWASRCRLHGCSLSSWLLRPFVYVCNHSVSFSSCPKSVYGFRHLFFLVKTHPAIQPSPFICVWGEALGSARGTGWRILSSWKSCLGVKLLDLPCQTSERAHQRGSFITNHRHHLC